MELTHVSGGSHLIQAPTNFGVHIVDNECIVVDTGFGRDNARRLLKILDKNHLRLKAVINTHCHADHCGGNSLISRRTGAKFYASRAEVPFIEEPRLHARTLFGQAYPPQDSSLRLLLGDPCRIDHPLGEGPLEIGNHRFHVVSLPGHSTGQVGILTEDDVLFAGDAIFTKQVIDKHPLPFYVDPDETIQSVKKLLELDVDRIVPGHGSILNRDEAMKHAEYYLSRIEAIDDMVLNTVRKPTSMDEIISIIATKLGVESNVFQHLLSSTTIKGHLTSLLQRGLVTMKLDGFQMVWHKV